MSIQNIIIKVKRELIPKRIFGCRNKNIICVIDEYENKNAIYIISEYIKGRGLNHYNFKDNRDLAIDIFYQLVTALLFMHSFKVYHRDIKPANILLRESDNTPIFIDFDNACISDRSLLACRGWPGTPNFMAPEIFDKEQTTDWETCGYLWIRSYYVLYI